MVILLQFNFNVHIKYLVCSSVEYLDLWVWSRPVIGRVFVIGLEVQTIYTQSNPDTTTLSLYNTSLIASDIVRYQSIR
jgi:hypothetical protein